MKKKKTKIYYICFNNCEGSFPQHGYYKTRKEADEVCKKWNEQCNVYCHYSVHEKYVYIN